MEPEKAKANHLKQQRKEAMKMMLLAIIAVFGFILLPFILAIVFIVPKMED